MDTTERRSGTWTVLFSDIVGSTEQRSRLGDERADALHDRVDFLQRRAVAASRGQVIKGLGDGIMVAFEAANDGFDAAVAIQQALELEFRGVDEKVLVRVGLAIGDARFEDDDLFGTPVVEAARLCSVCGTSEIYATDLTRLIAGSRLHQATESVGALTLKGLPEPVPTCRVPWEPLAAVEAPTAKGFPLPHLLVGAHRIAFAGRDAEMAEMQSAWATASGGAREVVMLAGEPGIGKSRLCAEMGRAVHHENGLLLYGKCDDEMGVPYQPFVEALAFFVEHWPAATLLEQLGPFPGELSRLVPSIRERFPEVPAPLAADPETERYRLFDAISGWLDALGRVSPVLLVLDDLHWATRPTLLLVKHLAQHGGESRVMLLGTYRDTDIDRQLTEILADLRRLPNVRRVPVSGIDIEGVLMIMELIAGHEMDSDARALAARVHEESEGNPFFVGELLRHLRESGAIAVDADGRWSLSESLDTLPIPEGVREVVARRIDVLPEASSEVLTAASVIGRDFDLPVLVDVLERNEGEVLELLDSCLDARIIEETAVGQYRFTHALVRSTLYDDLRVTRRARLHERVAEAIERLHADKLTSRYGELAFHYERGSAGAGSRKAAEYACLAGRTALQSLAHDEALARFETALDMFERNDLGAERRLEATLGLGLARRWTGHKDSRTTLFDAFAQAVAIGAVEEQVEAILALSRGWFGEFGLTDTDRIAGLRQALAAVGESDTIARSRLLSSLANELTFSDTMDARRALSDEALDIARRLGDAATIAYVLAQRHSAIYDVATLADRVALGEELRMMADKLGDTNLTFWSGFITWATGTEAADPARMRLGRALMGNAVNGSGSLVHRWCERFVEAGDALATGRLEDAERLASEAFALGSEAGEPDAFFYYGIQLVGIRTEQNNLDELADLIVSSAAAYPTMPEFGLLDVPMLQRDRRFDEIDVRLDRCMDAGVDALVRNQVRSTSLAFLAEAVVVANRTDVAQRVRAELAAIEAPIACNGLCTLRSLDVARARLDELLGNGDDATLWYERAVESAKRIGYVSLQARALAHQSRWLGATPAGKAAEAEARALAEEFGLSDVLRVLDAPPAAARS
ncbi:MAG: AAA family ATPase [Ilumatobacteraceae bacterium]